MQEQLPAIGLDEGVDVIWVGGSMARERRGFDALRRHWSRESKG